MPERNDGIGELVEVIVGHGEVCIVRWKTQQRFGEIIALQELRGILMQLLERNALAVLVRQSLFSSEISLISRPPFPVRIFRVPCYYRQGISLKKRAILRVSGRHITEKIA